MQRITIFPIIILVAYFSLAQVRAQPAQTQAVTPREITIHLSNFAFTPDHLNLRAGTPVLLRFINEAGGSHNFAAPAFFAASAFAPGVSPPPRGVVEVPARQTLEVMVTPRAPGSYSVECTHFLHHLFGMKGTIVVLAEAASNS